MTTYSTLLEPVDAPLAEVPQSGPARLWAELLTPNGPTWQVVGKCLLMIVLVPFVLIQAYASAPDRWEP